MVYTYPLANEKRGINSIKTFVDALDNRSVLSLQSFDEIMKQAEDLVRSEHGEVDKNALSNVRGNWYEWLLAVGVVEFNFLNPNSNYLLPLPNVSSYDCSRLYVERIHLYIQDLREKLGANAGVSLITSNPDFVIVDRLTNIDLPNISNGISEDVIVQIDNAYTQLSGLCKLDDIVGYASSKSSLRPDRRLQISHEGSLMKALYKHVITREWIINARGIKYYALTSRATDADRNGLRTVATHSIADVSSRAEAAVDGLFCISSGDELMASLEQIL